MSYPFTQGGATNVTATELVVSQYDQIQAEFEDVKYPEVLYDTEFDQASVKTDINPGAMNIVYRVRDIKGTGNFVNGSSRNIPRVGQVISQVTVPIQDGAVGFTLMDAEARRYQFAYQGSLAQDMGGIMKRAAEYHLERGWFFGDSDVNFLPYLDYPYCAKILASQAWASGTPADWVASINDAMTQLWVNSKTVYLPDVVELPLAKFSMLTEAYVIGAGPVGVAVSAMKYLIENNIYTANTGKPLTIRALRYLTGTAVDDGGGDRCIIKDSKAMNYMLPLPMPYQLAQPVPIALGVEGFAEYIFGSFHIKFPLAMLYLDGI
jgi:hypothetical protein